METSLITRCTTFAARACAAASSRFAVLTGPPGPNMERFQRLAAFGPSVLIASVAAISSGLRRWWRAATGPRLVPVPVPVVVPISNEPDPQ
jgi:hypothetical protein